MSVPSGGNIRIFKRRENNLFSVTCVKNSHGYFPSKFCKRGKKITFGLKLMRGCFPKGKIFLENEKIGNCHSRGTPLPPPVSCSSLALEASDRPWGKGLSSWANTLLPPSIFQWEEEGRVSPSSLKLPGDLASWDEFLPHPQLVHWISSLTPKPGLRKLFPLVLGLKHGP